MKLNDSRRTKTQDTAHETDFEDSIAMNKIKKLKNRSKLKKIKKTNMKKKKTSFLQKMTDLALHSKIMRFRLKNMKKTLRILCFRQKDLGWPIRFTRKIKLIACDNDNQTDSQLIQNQIQRGTNNLLKALDQQDQKKCK